MDNTFLNKAKDLLKNKYGEAVAKKATDRFCFYATGGYETLAVNPIGFEGIGVPPATSQQSDVIIEFEEEPLQKLRAGKDNSAVIKQINDLLETIKGKDELAINLQRVLQQYRMKAHREKIIKNINPINAFLERNIERTFAHGFESLRQQPYLTKTCWLNQTVRTIAHPRSLSEIAADPKISKLDIPRKLIPEINDTGKVVFAPQYRQKFSQTGKGVVVAVIDSEIDINHPAFGSRVMQRMNYTKEPWGNPHSHATGVAGIIASGDPVFIGMAPEATIYNYKVLATSSTLNADDFEGVLAIQKALEDGAHLANCSWGIGPATDGTGREARACNQAWNLGLTIVKSAGNTGPGIGTLSTPADAEGIIVVGATGKDGQKVQQYSSRGPLSSGESRPHLVAPGGSDLAGIFSCLTGGGFGNIGKGTSFATPHVTGLLALITEGNPSLSPDDLRKFLLKLCTKLKLFTDDDQGAGIISMASLL